MFITHYFYCMRLIWMQICPKHKFHIWIKNFISLNKICLTLKGEGKYIMLVTRNGRELIQASRFCSHQRPTPDIKNTYILPSMFPPFLIKVSQDLSDISYLGFHRWCDTWLRAIFLLFHFRILFKGVGYL